MTQILACPQEEVEGGHDQSLKRRHQGGGTKTGRRRDGGL